MLNDAQREGNRLTTGESAKHYRNLVEVEIAKMKAAETSRPSDICGGARKVASPTGFEPVLPP